MKFTLYKSIPSLKEYLLIATARALVTQFTRSGENEWLQREAAGFEASLLLSRREVKLLLSEIYVDIKFPKYLTICYRRTARRVKSPTCSPLHVGLSGMAAVILANDQT